MAIEQDREKSNELNNSNILAITAQENATPVAQDDEITGAFSGMLRITPEELLANDSDLDGDTLRGVSIQDAENGTVYWDGTHVVFVGAAGYSGPASFSYTVTDDQGGFDTATVSLSVIANTPPAVVDDHLNGIMDGVVIIDPETLLANDSDAEGSALNIVSIQDAVNGVVFYNGSQIVFTPDVGYQGPASFSYTVIDGQGATSTATVNLTIAADTSNTNTAPDAQDDALTAEAGRIVFIKPETLLANDSDIDGDAIAGVSIQDAVNGRVVWDGEHVVFVPVSSDSINAASFTYTITDIHGATDTATVDLSITPYAEAQNSNFRLDPDYIISKNEGAFKIDALRLLDGDRGDGSPIVSIPQLLYGERGDGLKIVSVQDAVFGEVRLDAQGDIVFTPQKDYQGYAAFSYTVEDSNGDRRTEIVNVDVQTPVELTIDSGSGDHNFELTNITNIAASYEKIIIDAQTKNGSVFQEREQWGFGNGKVTLYYNPDQDFLGQDSFEYTEKTYSNEYSSTVYTIGTVKLSVIENHPPEAVADRLNTATNSTLVTPLALLTANDKDTEGQSVFVLSVQDAVNGSVIIENGNAIFTPDQGFVGAASYTYTIADNRGNTDIQTVTVLVSDEPVTTLVDGNEQNTLAEGSELIVVRDSEDNLLNNANLPDAVITSFTLGDNPTVYSPDTFHEITSSTSIRINYDGSYEFRTTSDFNGAYPTIHYTVNSGEQSVTSTLDLNLTPINDAPKVSSAYTTTKIGNNGERYLITTTDALIDANASDVDGDILAITAVQSDDGIAELVGNDIYFTPFSEVTQSARFEYVVSDGNGGMATGVYSMDVVNGPLIELGDDQVTTNANAAIIIPLSELVENDRIVHYSGFGEDYVSTVQEAVNGTVAIDGESVVFTPTAGYTGPASFSYTVSQLGISKTATVNLSIGEAAVDTPDRLVDDVFESDGVATRYYISAELLTQNDDIGSEDYSLAGFNAQNGSVERTNLTAFGTVYTDGFYFYKQGINADKFAFDYLINDGQGNISIATVDLKLPMNQTPVASSETIFITGDLVVIPNQYLLANDTDPEADPLTLTSTQNAVGGAVSADLDQVTFERDGTSESTSFQYSIGDSRGNFDFAQVEVIKQADGNFIGTDRNDIMYANREANLISAGDGDDVIIAGGGEDRIAGGLGADTFVWSIDDINQGEVLRTTITDFDAAEDNIDIADLIDQSTVPNPTANRLGEFVEISVEGEDTLLSVSSEFRGDTELEITLEGVALNPLSEFGFSAITFGYTEQTWHVNDYKDNFIVS